MRSKTVKTLSYVAFFAGAISALVSGILYLNGKLRPQGGKSKLASLFIGMWTPTMFTLSEMLDRLSIEDREYVIPINRRNTLLERGRRLIRR